MIYTPKHTLSISLLVLFWLCTLPLFYGTQVKSNLDENDWLLIEKNDQSLEEVRPKLAAYPSPVNTTYMVKPTQDRIGWILTNRSYRSFFLTSNSFTKQSFHDYLKAYAFSKSEQLAVYIETFVYDDNQQPLHPIVYLIYFKIPENKTKEAQSNTSTYQYSGQLVIQGFNPCKHPLSAVKIANKHSFYHDTPLFGSLTHISYKEIISLRQMIPTIQKKSLQKGSFMIILPKKLTFKLFGSLICCKPSLIYVTYFLGHLIEQNQLAKPLPILLLDNKLCLNNPKHSPNKLTKKIKKGIEVFDTYADDYPVDWRKAAWSSIVRVKLVDNPTSKSVKKENKQFSSKELLKKVGYSPENKSQNNCLIM